MHKTSRPRNYRRALGVAPGTRWSEDEGRRVIDAWKESGLGSSSGPSGSDSGSGTGGPPLPSCACMQLPDPIAVGETPKRAAAGGFNGDGRMDFAVHVK